ncbi:MAG: autotransporter-associated beta strand repeat-containing protein [Akkermansia sp.]|nr:autotransporter-associated beta strand repeat-containing protein [Akkermansia sp.]
MKLHLPKGLRSAVLACMAVVGGIATTVGTGFVAGGSVAIAFVAAQAQAATYEITSSGDGNLTSATADDQIILNLTGWLTPNGELNVNAPVEIVKGEINDGSSNRTYTFKNTITGSGDFSYCPQSGRGANNQTYVFEGDMSAYSGNMSVVADKKGTFTFKGTTGTGSVTALNAESVVNIEGATVNNSSIDAATINISGAASFRSGISLNASRAINNSATITLDSVTLGRTITNTGAITLSGEVSLSESMLGEAAISGNGFAAEGYIIASGTGAIALTEGAKLMVNGVDVTSDYVDGVVVTSQSTTYYVSEADSTVDSSTVEGETGYIITGNNASLVLTDLSGSIAESLPGGVTVNVGNGNSATVEIAGAEMTFNANDITRNSGTLNVTVGDGTTLELTQNTGSPRINGDLTIKAGGVVNGTTGDVFGWGGSATKNVILLGEEGKLATLNLSNRVTQSTNFVLGGNAQILSTSAADASDPASLDTFDGKITATGTNNTIGVAIRERKALTIEVTGAEDNLDITGRIYRSVSTDGAGSITKTGAGTLTLSYSSEDNTNEITGLVNVEAGTLKFAGDTKLRLGIKVAADASLVNEGIITLTSLDLLNVVVGDSYQDANGVESENGYLAGRFAVIEAQAGATITGVDSVVLGGETLTTGVDEATGSIYIAGVDKSTYWVNTQVAYDAETMAEVGSFSVAAGATLTTTDATMLNKVTLADATSSLYLTNSEGTNVLKFTGAQGGAGLPLDVAAEVDEDGYLVVNSSAGNNVDYRGTIVVLNGTKLVAASNPDSFGKNYLTDTSRTITVQGGAVVDLNGMESYYHYVLEAGAVVTNSSGAIDTGKRNMPIVDLLGDAEFRFDNRAGIIGSGYGDTQLNLNGHTLTKVGAGVFHLRNTDVSAGTLNVQEGTLEWLADSTMTNTTLQLGGGALLNHDGGSQNLGSLVIATTVGSGTGATIDVYGGRGPLTVTGATKADELLTKKGTGQLNLNGSTVLNAGLTIENGTVALNSATTIGGVITLTGGTLTVGTNGSISIGSLADFAGTDTEVTVPETNGLVTIAGATYKVLDKAEGATVNNFTAVNYGGTAYTLSADGSITIDGGKIYYAVEAGSVVTVGGDSATAGTADATEFYVKDGATLAFAGTQSGSFTPAKTVNGDGTVRIAFADGNHDKGVSMSSFAGTVEIAGGNSNITTYRLGEGATLKLTAGEHWSNGGTSNLDILLSDTKNAYVFRQSYELTLTGKVSGQYLDLGTTNSNGGTMTLTNSANDIKHVTVGTANNTAKLTLAADMGFTTINAAKADSVVTLNDGVTLTLGTGTAAETSAVTTMALAGNGGLNISEQAALTITTQQGGGTLTKDGAGSLTITGNSAAGALVINGGELVVNGATMAATTVSGDGTLKLAGDTNTFSNGVTLSGKVDFNGKGITGDLTLADTATVTGVVSASNIAVGTYTNATGMATAGDITVGTALNSSAELTATKIAGAGNVNITGGKVTLTDTTDAFANTGSTTISGAELAGTWNADGVTIGSGTTVSGTIGLANSTINGTITATGTVNLSGTVVISDGVSRTEGTVVYSGGANGYKTATTEYAVVSGGTATAADGTQWFDGTTALTGTYTNGVFSAEGSAGTVYYANSGTVQYNGGSEFSKATGLCINGGTLQLATSTLADGFITSAAGGTLDLNGQSISQSAFGTLSGAVAVSGSGTYDLAGAAALASNVTLGEGWTGTVKLSNAAVSNFNVDTLANGASSTVEISGVTGYLSQANSTAQTYAANVKLTNADGAAALTFNNGWNGDTRTFAGAVSGSGDMVRAGDKGSTQNYIFAGDTSGWTGKFDNALTRDFTTNLTFSGSAAINASLINSGAGILNVTIDDANLGASTTVMVNGAITATSLAVTEGTTAKFAAPVVVNTVNAAGSTVTASTLTLNAGTGSFGSLAIGTAGSQGTLTLGALVNGGITLSGALTGNFLLDISTDMLTTALVENPVTLITAGSISADIAFGDGTSLRKDGYLYELVNQGGSLVLSAALAGNPWDGSEGSQWSENEGDSWGGGAEPGSQGESALFNGSGDSQVGIAGTVTPDEVTISVSPDSTVSEYTFSDGSKTVIDEAGNETTEPVIGVVEASGVLNANAGSLTINNASTSFAGEESVVREGFVLQVGDGVADEIIDPEQQDDSLRHLTFNSNLTNNGELSVNSDGQLTVVGAVANSNSLNVGSETDNGGKLVVEEGMANSGSLSATGGSITIGAELTNSAHESSIELKDASLTVAGDVQNEGSIVISGSSIMKVGNSLLNSGSITVDAQDVQMARTETPGGLDIVGDFNNSGDIVLNNGAISITGDFSATTKLTRNTEEQGSLTLNKGKLTVGGTLSGVDLGEVGEGLDISVGRYDAVSLNVKGSYTVTGTGSTIGTLTTEGNGTVSLAENAEINLTGDSSIAINESNGHINAAGQTLTLTAASAAAGDLTAKTLDLTSATGTQAGKVLADSIVFDGGLTALGDSDDVTPVLTVTSMGTAETEINFSGMLENGEYLLVSSDEGVDVVVNNDYSQEMLLDARTIELSEVSRLSAHLSSATLVYAGVRDLTEGERTWYTSKSESEGGLYITDTTDDSSLVYGYETLNTINHVVVDEDQVIDLSTISPTTDNPSLMLRDLSGDKTLTLEGDGDDSVTIEGGEMTGGIAVGNVNVQATDLTVATLTGTSESTLSGAITVTGTADWDGLYGGATIAVTKGAVAALTVGEGLTVKGSAGTIELEYADDATMDAIRTTGADVELAGAAGKTLTLAENSSMVGGSLNLGVNTSTLGAGIVPDKHIAGKLSLTNTSINVEQADDALVINVGSGTTVIADLDKTTGSATVTLSGKGFDKYFINERLEGGMVVADRRTDYVKSTVKPESENGAAGTTLLDDSLVNINPQAAPDLAPTQAELLDAVDSGYITDKDAAAVAGASIATMGMALSGDVERQLRAIRNRTTSMGVNECVVNEGMPYFNAWVNAEGNRGDLDRSGTNAGYTIDSWGGTVGFDVDFDPNFSAGMAITAMYGNLTANGPEAKAEGDMDTYYVSLFARYAEYAWTHTFVATVGMMDGSFDRTVNAGGAGYQTEGSTDGMSFGLMYEVGHVMPLDEDATACLQPVFNVMLRHSSVGSYTERGSDAGLDVGSQSMTVLTFGLGARLQAVVGESLYNRASIFEARALAKFDVGDRSSEADVAFIGGKATSAVESAELGAFGVELGAGLTIPVGDDDGAIFIDGSLELRSGYSNVNGTVGYRINF